MAAEQKIINGRLYEARPLYANVKYKDGAGVEQTKKLDGFSMVPVLPDVFPDLDELGNPISGKLHKTTDEDCQIWLDKLVAEGLYSWSVIARFVRSQTSIDAHDLAFPGVTAEQQAYKNGKTPKPKDSLTTPQLMEVYSIYVPKAKAALGPNPDEHSQEATKIYDGNVIAEAMRLYQLDHATSTDYSNWQVITVMPNMIK